MPTIFTHALLPLAGAATARRNRSVARLAFVGALLSIAPDLDVVGFHFGIDYASLWGHRGASHSLLTAAIVALAVALVWKPARRPGAFIFLFASMASHGLLDMLTDGGKGVAYLWPLYPERLFLPWRPIRVSPIGARFFSPRGLETLGSELLLVWMPVLLALGLWRTLRR